MSYKPTRRIVLAVNDALERQAITQLLDELNMKVYHAYDVPTVLILLEDQHPCDLLILDAGFENPWDLFTRLRERPEMAHLPKMILTDAHEVALVGLIQVIRPYSMMRLRKTIVDVYQLNYDYNLLA